MIDAADLPPEKCVPSSSCLRLAVLAATSMLLALFGLPVPVAQAGPGYEPDEALPVIDVEGEVPLGVAVDQVSHRIYVAIPIKSLSKLELGQINQLESSGVPTAASPFRVNAEAFFTGVAVNPVTQLLYAAEIPVSTPFGIFGASKVDQFSPTGTLGTQFATTGGLNEAPIIATDSTGRLFYPNPTVDAVQIFDSTGALQETIGCGACPGGSFNDPTVVALDSQDNLYVIDLDDRVLKFTHPGGSYVFSSVLQSGRGAVAVSVDLSDNSVFVGNSSGGDSYHIVAYDSSGMQFDDFGSGLFPEGSFGGVPVYGQIAVNASTRKVYVTDPGASAMRVFSRVPSIDPPSVTTEVPSPVGQIEATLKATVNANLHATIDCHFEYTEDDDFLVNGYANATDLPCSSMPVGSQDTVVTASLQGLPPSTTYHYRTVAANNAGSVNGSSQTFTTLPVVAATVTTGEGMDVKRTSATLSGKVNPHGGSVSDCHFEYGTSTSYKESIPCPSFVGPVSSDVSQSLKITGLSTSTTYHFRLVVTSNAGTVNGVDKEFTTLSNEQGGTPPGPVPPPVIPPPEEVVTPPPPAVVTPPKKVLRCKKGFRKAKVRGKLRCVKKRKPRRR